MYLFMHLYARETVSQPSCCLIELVGVPGLRARRLMKRLELHFIGKMPLLIAGVESPLIKCQSIEGRAGLNSDEGDVIVSAAGWSEGGKLSQPGQVRGTELREPRCVTKSEISVSFLIC